MGAVEEKKAGALTATFWLGPVPSSVLPATTKVLDTLARVTPPVKVAVPLLLMMTRSSNWLVLLLVLLTLPGALVLNTRLPPSVPAGSCSGHKQVNMGLH